MALGKRNSKIYVSLILVIALSVLLSIIVEAGGGKGKPPPPPPPPPPCPIKSAGCYKTGDVKVGFGELAPSDFAYYLPENKCIQGSCTCGSVSPNVAEETNPDDSSGACNCIAGTAWDARGRCCGNDGNDCGKTSTGVLCSIDANFQSAQWIASSPNLGDIRYVGCIRAEYLSDGGTWRKCDGVFWRQTVGNSEYMCIGRGRESIVECCGDGSCKSRIDGKRLSTGQSVNPSKFENEQLPVQGVALTNITGNVVAPGDSKTYYCTPARKFVTDLDVNQPGVGTSDRQLTCEKAGFAWTGTKCCSEDDDQNEYYNDIDGTGGCWNEKPIISISFVDNTDNSVINYKGQFIGCAIGKSNFNKNNDVLLNLADKHTGESLILDEDYCITDPENNYYCSYTEKILPTEGSDRTHLSSAPVSNPKQQSECCAKDECWDGEKCTENQRGNPAAQPINGLRCIDGEWAQSELKFNPDDSTSGFCPKKTQCLVNVFGKNESAQCIDSEQYVEDNYCENGNWTSRTKFLALKLLKIKSGDYTVFCDDRENALNNLQYLTVSNEIVASILTSIQTNNFCVLKSGSKIIAATSINKNLEDVPSNNLNIFGVTSCNNALIDDGQYHSCDSTNKVWFNKRLKSFIYSSTAITVPSEEELPSFIKNIIKNIIDSIKRLVTTPPFDESYLKGVKKFNKLFMAEEAGKSVRGSIEGKNIKNAVVQYTGFDTDICNFVDKFNEAKKDVSSGISCKKEGNNYYVLAQGSQLSNLDPDSIWPDLTSKLRLK